jgi:hypothetical protein
MPKMTTKMATPNRQNLQEFAQGGQDGQQLLSPCIRRRTANATGGRTWPNADILQQRRQETVYTTTTRKVFYEKKPSEEKPEPGRAGQ